MGAVRKGRLAADRAAAGAHHTSGSDLRALTRFARGQGGEVKKLTDDGQNRYRIRVGDYRVLFAFEDRDTLRIFSVENRKNAYR